MRQVFISVLAGIMGGFIAMTGLAAPDIMAKSDQKIVKAQLFQVVDDNGEVVANFGIKKDLVGKYCGVQINDSEKTIRLGLYRDSEKGLIGLDITNGFKTVITLTADEKLALLSLHGDMVKFLGNKSTVWESK